MLKFFKKEEPIINIERYDTDINTGLTSEQVLKRQEELLTNKTTKGSNKSIFSIFCHNIFTFFNAIYIIIFILLLTAGADLANFLFVAIVLANTSIGIIQEIRSKMTIDKLSLLSAPHVYVIRNGEKQEIKVEEIVLDDMMVLAPGNEITTDAILVSGEVEVNESQLTGESIPVIKKIGDMLYSGSFIVSGNCYARVEHVGKDNEMEKLASQAKKYSKPKSEILTSLSYFLRFVSIIIVPVAIVLYCRAERISSISEFFISFFDHSDTYSGSIISMSGSIIGMIPAGLFLLTTVALAVGVIRLARHKTLVQEIYCIEMLARVDVLCLDKTGTITDGTMKVSEVISITKNIDYDLGKVIASMNKALQENNATANALADYFGYSSKYQQKSILPFKSENKYSAVTFKDLGTFVIGAPEFVLKGNYERYEELIKEKTSLGYRVLALGECSKELKDGKIVGIPKLIALVVIEDQIRKEAFETIKYFKDNNVTCKVISGDNPLTVSVIAGKVGIDNAENYISLDGMSDEEVYEAAEKYTVFGRVKPHQKQIIVKALKNKKHTVAMTGDGVNDILALKEADCSIAMASGCDAVRNVAQLVLLDSNFASMPKVVAEGRRVVNNIQQSASLFLVKTLFTMIITILVITGFIAKFSPDGSSNYPFSTAQLFMIETFAIGIPAFFLSLQPNKSIIKGKFLLNVIRNALPGALTVAIQVFVTYMVAESIGLSALEVKTIIVISATATCMMVLYFACKPFATWKVVMYVGLVFLCLIVVVNSVMGVKTPTFLGTFDWYRQFRLESLVRYAVGENGEQIIIPTSLLMVLALSMSSYIIIFVINYVIDVLRGKKKTPLQTDLERLAENINKNKKK